MLHCTRPGILGILRCARDVRGLHANHNKYGRLGSTLAGSFPTSPSLCLRITAARCLQGGLATPLSKHLKRYKVLASNWLFSDLPWLSQCHSLNFSSSDIFRAFGFFAAAIQQPPKCAGAVFKSGLPRRQYPRCGPSSPSAW